MSVLDNYTTSLDGLRHGDDKYEEHVPEGHNEEDPDPPDYERRIPIGEDVRTGRTVWMRLSKSDRIGIWGRTGSGKTTLSKTLISRFYLSGYGLLYPNDVKNDFQDIDYKGGASQKLIDEHDAGRYPGEVSSRMPKQMYAPPFLLEEYRNKPSYIKPFTFGLSDISEGELLDLLQLTSNTQKRIVSDIWNSHDDLTFSQLENLLKDSEDYNDQAAAAVLKNVSTLKKEKVLTDYERYDKSPLEDLPEEAVVIAFKKWKKFKREGSEKLEMYISIILRKLMDMIEAGEIDYDKGIVVFIDEAHAFCGTDGTPISREDIIDLVDLGRAYDIPMIFSSQRPSQLPKEDIVSQMSHHFVSKSVPVSDLIDLLKEAKILDHADYSNDRWTKILREMGKYQRLYIDTENSRYQIIEPYAPLVAHRDSA